MATCPNCGYQIGFVRYFLSDHVTGECVNRLLDKAEGVEEE